MSTPSIVGASLWGTGMVMSVTSFLLHFLLFGHESQNRSLVKKIDLAFLAIQLLSGMGVIAGLIYLVFTNIWLALALLLATVILLSPIIIHYLKYWCVRLVTLLIMFYVKCTE